MEFLKEISFYGFSLKNNETLNAQKPLFSQLGISNERIFVSSILLVSNQMMILLLLLQISFSHNQFA